MENVAKGFTLIELLIVIGIISIITFIGVLQSPQIFRKSQQAKARSELEQIATAITQLGMDTGLSPNKLPLQPCVQNPEFNLNTCSQGLFSRCSATDYPGWKGPYLSQKLMTDQWGSSYVMDMDYYCRPDVAGCENVVYTQNDGVGPFKIVRAILTYGQDRANNYCGGAGGGCTRTDKDNVVLVMCGQ